MPPDRNKSIARGTRPYAHYTKDALEKALLEAYSGKPLRYVAEKFGVPRSTLCRHMHGKNTGKYGRPPVFDKEEEDVVVECISMAGEWGFPLTKYDLRCTVKAHLDRKGIRETRFKNNFPGIGWTNCFIARHKDKLTERLSQNIKRSRAAVDAENINEYFDELEVTLKDVEPALILNYDETNLTDDPKRQKVIVRRSCRHPERIVDSSKSSTSVMFTCAGDGQVLPVYVTYRSEHLYDTWTTGGPSGTIYNRSKTGWFTMEIIEDWFRKVVIPYFRRFPKEKPKVLIGDNLASHVSAWVIQKCVAENIRFVLLPPNSTGICQPLDVAFFKPLKTQWSKVLTEWKMTHRGVVPKDTFPRLLKQCLEEMRPKTADNVRSGFRGSGLIPLDRNEVLKRLPQQNDSQNLNDKSNEWVGSFRDFLQDFRKKETQPMRQIKKKKLNVKPGMSASNTDKIEEQDEQHEKSNRKGNKVTKEKQKEKKKKLKRDESETETDTDATMSLQDSDSDIDFIDFDYHKSENQVFGSDEESISLVPDPLAMFGLDIQEPDGSKTDIKPFCSLLRKVDPKPGTSKDIIELPDPQMKIELNATETNKTEPVISKHDETEVKNFTAEDFVVVKFLYNETSRKPIEKRFVGKVINAHEDSVFVNIMRKSTKAKNTFIFPHVLDEQLVAPENVIAKVEPSKISRGRYLFPEFINIYSCS